MTKLLVLLSMFCLACGTVDVAPTAPAQSEKSLALGDLCLCFSLYQPVCGNDGVTYENTCRLDCAGATVASEGACEVHKDKDTCESLADNGCNACSYDEATDTASCAGDHSIRGQLETAHPYGKAPIHLVIVAPAGVTTITLVFSGFSTFDGLDVLTVRDSRGKVLEELSGNLGAIERTYSSEALDLTFSPISLMAQFFNWRSGFAIERIVYSSAEAASCSCSDIYDPVCAADGKTYGNTCEAECAGIDVSYAGQCQDLGQCFCMDLYAPVCGANGTTYSNSCEAECGRAEIAHDGACTAATP